MLISAVVIVFITQVQSRAACWSRVTDTASFVWCAKYKSVGRGKSHKRRGLADWVNRRSTSDGS